MDATWKNAVRSAVPTLRFILAMLAVMVSVENATIPKTRISSDANAYFKMTQQQKIIEVEVDAEQQHEYTDDDLK